MKIAQSPFWPALWERYSRAPSIALCRVPELEYASSLAVEGAVLDHCCGDGFFAALAWNRKRVLAGCDLSENSIAQARRLGIYDQLDVCDAAKELPYKTGSMRLVFNNSALEHIPDLDSALLEVSRVLKPGGEFAFNVLNHRYFEWWPLDESSKQAYREWQPFYHALALDEWAERLSRAGLRIVSNKGYFDRVTSRRFATLDYWFSGYYNHSLPFWYVKLYLRLGSILSSMLKRQLEDLAWGTSPDKGAGYFIQAVKHL